MNRGVWCVLLHQRVRIFGIAGDEPIAVLGDHPGEILAVERQHGEAIGAYYVWHHHEASHTMRADERHPPRDGFQGALGEAVDVDGQIDLMLAQCALNLVERNDLRARIDAPISKVVLANECRDGHSIRAQVSLYRRESCQRSIGHASIASAYVEHGQRRALTDREVPLEEVELGN